MRFLERMSASVIAATLVMTGIVIEPGNSALAQRVVPGTGRRMTQVDDNFEDPKWSYNYNQQKSSYNIDEQQRQPGGMSKNGIWYESLLRGQPDLVQRVATPEGGLPGSTGAMMMRSLYTGIPGRPSGKNQQDDLLLNVANKVGGHIPVSRSPSVVVRVFLPPFDEWEPRTGNSFAVRAGAFAYTRDKESFTNRTKLEEYWPGMFIYFYSKTDGRTKEDSAALLVRAGPTGHDFFGPKITESGWWTLGMSFTPDGQVHYYGHAGVEDLTEADHITSQFPYGFRCDRFQTFFFNVINSDNGRNWSTKWIVDDPALYVVR
jgi:hypothetical protein